MGYWWQRIYSVQGFLTEGLFYILFIGYCIVQEFTYILKRQREYRIYLKFFYFNDEIRQNYIFIVKYLNINDKVEVFFSDYINFICLQYGMYFFFY